jgi:hypothetical protein
MNFMPNRMVRIARAMAPYTDVDDHGSAMIDILSDLQHYAQAVGVNFDNALRVARAHYAVESTENQRTSA